MINLVERCSGVPDAIPCICRHTPGKHIRTAVYPFCLFFPFIYTCISTYRHRGLNINY
jgi:hypothetical protein